MSDRMPPEVQALAPILEAYVVLADYTRGDLTIQDVFILTAPSQRQAVSRIMKPGHPLRDAWFAMMDDMRNEEINAESH